MKRRLVKTSAKEEQVLSSRMRREKLTEEQQLILRELTDDFRLDLRDHAVKELIKNEPKLNNLTKQQIVDCKKNVKRSRKPGKKGQKLPEQTQSEKTSVSLKRFKAQTDAYGCSESAATLPLCSQLDIEKKQGEKDRLQPTTLSKQQAQLLLERAAKRSDVNELNQAVVSRIQCPAEDKNAEVLQLLYLLRDEEAHMLAEKLIQIHNWQNVQIAEDTDEELMIYAFIKVADLYPPVIKNQGLLCNYLYPALKTIKGLPEFKSELHDDIWKVYDAMTQMLVEQDNLEIPHQLYQLGHQIGMVLYCMNQLHTHRKGQTDALKYFLSWLGLPESTQKMVVRFPNKLGYSPLLNLLRTYQEENQVPICHLLLKLTINVDPTESVREIQQVLMEKLFLRDEFKGRKDLIDLQPHKFLRILKMLKDLNRKQVHSIIGEDVKRWKHLAIYQHKAIESGRPEILKDNDKFLLMASKEGKVPLYIEMRDVAQILESACSSFVSNAFQTFVAHKIAGDDKRVTTAILPTGSGKSYIAAILSGYYTSKNERPVIVTSSNFLVDQLTRMLGHERQNIPVMTMKDVLAHQNSFSVFIIDESDVCLLEDGHATDELNKKVEGFWNLLDNRTILLTATVGVTMEDVLYQLYDIKIADYMNFNPHMKTGSQITCKSTIQYKIFDNEIQYWQGIEAMVKAKYNQKPVIVFLDQKKKIDRLQKYCDDNSLRCSSALNDQQLEGLMSVVRQKDQGILITWDRYGRGADIRFKIDSYVVIGFIPQNMSTVKQMTGRSSRTMGSHQSMLIAQDKFITSESVYAYLKERDRYEIKDGIDVVKVLRGRKRAGARNDSDIIKLFKKGWMINANQIKKAMTIQNFKKCLELGQRDKDRQMKQEKRS